MPFLFDCCLGVSIRRCPAQLLAKASPNSWSDFKVSEDWQVETNVQIGVDAWTPVCWYIGVHASMVVWLRVATVVVLQ